MSQKPSRGRLNNTLMFDLHSHIVFGVDDGARSFEESKALLQEAKVRGIDQIMCTPHCRWDSFDKRTIQMNFDSLQEYAESQNIKLDLGFEVNWKKLGEFGVELAGSLCLGNTGMFLLEFSDESMPPNWESSVHKLQSAGLLVVIAHPERYRAVQNNLDVAKRMKELGCLIQVSANFMQDGLFGARKKTVMALLKEDLVDYVASDAHRIGDYEKYIQALAYFKKHAQSK